MHTTQEVRKNLGKWAEGRGDPQIASDVHGAELKARSDREVTGVRRDTYEELIKLSATRHSGDEEKGEGTELPKSAALGSRTPEFAQSGADAI